MDLIKAGDLTAFESQCLELLESGTLRFEALVACFKQLEATGNAGRIPTLAQMVLENADLAADPPGALAVACIALSAAPDSADLRGFAVDLYPRVHGQKPGFAAVLESSGLARGAPARTALRVLDFCLSLNVGDTLIGRLDDRVVEVVEVDRQRGLFTLRRGDRTTTVPAGDVVREYERVDPDDFRALRQLRPERLADLIHQDPVALVIGLIHAHGGLIDADRLKHELVPKYIDAKEWPKWWSKTRTLLKRAPHVLVEGRAPVVLKYSAEGITLEEEAWTAFTAAVDPLKWLDIIDGYLREQKSSKHEPDRELVQRFCGHIVKRVAAVRRRRPAEALASALVLDWLAEQGVPLAGPVGGLATEILRGAADAAALFASLTDETLWARALAELPQARPDDWADCAARLVPSARATHFDALVRLLRSAGRLDGVQQAVDAAMAELIEYPEVVYWLWKGPEDATGLQLPSEAELFAAMLDALSALGVTVLATPDVTRHFRSRMKAALSLRDYARVRACLQQASPEAAVTLRRQLERLEGLGDNAPAAMLESLRRAHPQLWVTRVERLAPWEEPEVIWCTAAGLEKKGAELKELINVKMHENARRIGEAAAHGDLSENSEYKFALEERDLLRARMAQMNRDLSQARPLETHNVPTDHVGVGSRVSLRGLSDGAVRQMTFLGPFETDVEAGIYNYKAPTCQKLMGLRVGERVALTLDGITFDFEVVSIENGLQRGGA